MKKSTNLEPYTKKIAQYTHEFVSGGTGNFDYNNIEAIIKKLNETKASDHKASAVLITKITKFLINSAKQVNGLKYNLLDSICEHASEAENDTYYNEDLETLKKLNEAFTQDDNLYTYDINSCKHNDDNIRKYVYTLQLVSGLYLIFTKQEKYLPADAIKPAIPIIKFKKDYLPNELLTAENKAFKEIYKNIKNKLRKDLPVVVALGDEKLEDKDKEKVLEDKDKEQKKKEVLDKIYEKEKEISLVIQRMFDFTKFEKVSKILVYRNIATEFVDITAHHTDREEAILQELTNIRDDIYIPVDEIISKYFEYNFDVYNWKLKDDALNNTFDDINKSLDELTKIYDRLKEQSNEKILGILTNFELELGNDDKVEEDDETKKGRYLKEITELIIIRIKFIKKIKEIIEKIEEELPHIGIMIDVNVDVNESDKMVLRENDLNDEDINPTEKKALETLIHIFNERYFKMLKNSKEIFIKYFVNNENDSDTLSLKDTSYYATIPLEQFENDLAIIKTYDIDSLNTDMYAQYKIIIDNEEIKRSLKSIDEKYEGIANHKFTNYKISRTDINTEYIIEKMIPDLQLTHLRDEIEELNKINSSLKVTFEVYTGFKELVKKHQEEENTEENTEIFKEEIKDMDNYIQRLVINLNNFEPYNENNNDPHSMMRGSVASSGASLTRDSDHSSMIRGSVISNASSVRSDNSDEWMVGGRNLPKYKSTGRTLFILYKNKKYKKTIYVKEKSKTEYCKINNEYILLSALNIIGDQSSRV